MLPINSALNPFLYTFTTTKFRSQIRRFLTGHGVCLCVWVPRQDTGWYTHVYSGRTQILTWIYRFVTGRDVCLLVGDAHDPDR